MNHILTVQNLIVKRGGVTVLDISELNVEQGRILALIGPNGAGKSTLLLTMAGLLKPDQGKIYYQGNACGQQCQPLSYAPKRLRCFSGTAAAQYVRL